MNLNALQRQIIERASGSASFRARLLQDAAAAIKEETGMSVPAGLTVAAHEDADEGLEVTVSGAMSLSDAELAGVVGGNQPVGTPDTNPWYPFANEGEATAAWKETYGGTDPPWAD